MLLIALDLPAIYNNILFIFFSRAQCATGWANPSPARSHAKVKFNFSLGRYLSYWARLGGGLCRLRTRVRFLGVSEIFKRCLERAFGTKFDYYRYFAVSDINRFVRACNGVSDAVWQGQC